MLIEKFNKSLQDMRIVVGNSYLIFLKGAIEKIESVASSNPELVDYINKLAALIDRPDFALDGRSTNEFAQTLGEAHFFAFCLEKGVVLNRIPEQKHKTPDFVLKTNRVDLFFEVKTLSVVDGQIGIDKHLDDSLDSKIKIEEQLKAGKKIASTTTIVQPYGEKPYKKGNGTIAVVIETLIEKTRQNIKRDQFSNANTFLVVNLSIIPPFCTENYTLRPAYYDDYLFKKAVTGDLWMLAFGKPGMLIHGIPEFEGQPGIDGIFNKYGILSDPEFDYIVGILLMVYPWQRPTEIWGLFSSQRYNCWEKDNPDIITNINTLTGSNWNDDMDSNGWILQGYDRKLA